MKDEVSLEVEAVPGNGVYEVCGKHGRSNNRRAKQRGVSTQGLQESNNNNNRSNITIIGVGVT